MNKILFVLVCLAIFPSAHAMQTIKNNLNQIKETTKKVKDKIKLKLSRKKPFEKVILAYDQFITRSDKELERKLESYLQESDVLLKKINDNLKELQDFAWRDSDNNNVVIEDYQKKNILNQIKAKYENQLFKLKASYNLATTQMLQAEFQVKESEFIVEELKDLEKKDKQAAHEFKDALGFDPAQQKEKAQNDVKQEQEKRKSNLAALQQIVDETTELKKRYVGSKNSKR